MFFWSAMNALRQARPEVQCHLLALSDGPLLDLAAKLGVETTVLPAPAGLQAFGDSRLNQAKGRIRRTAALLIKALPLAWMTWRYLVQLGTASVRLDRI